MDDLDDHMLTQILLRLPNCKTVLACSPVNKRWYSLISDPNFSDQFADHKKKTTTLLKGSGSDHEDDEPPWTFITNLRFMIRKFTFGSQKLFLPCNTSPPVATFKDLVLTCQLGGLVYYITNPLTKQSVALPPCPADKHQRRRITTFLICQPSSNHNQDYKFRVGEIRNFRKEHSLDTCYLVVYCSEIDEWKEINLRVPKEARPHRLWNTEPEIVVCNGIIYFKSGLCLVALDPFDVNVACGTTLEARVMPPLPRFWVFARILGTIASRAHSLVVVPKRWDGY
ncbi:uncharacterized protein LOC141632796 [Silene latifolia]|uniref:uncharacterized protein LOC141632796 n=1 Tax=Silene latifolia TaxID=37657 RepID=UPI003D78527E